MNLNVTTQINKEIMINVTTSIIIHLKSLCFKMINIEHSKIFQFIFNFTFKRNFSYYIFFNFIKSLHTNYILILLNIKLTEIIY